MGFFDSTMASANVKEMIANGAAIIDVRTPGEFMGGKVAGSLNFPLQTIDRDIEQLRAMNKPLVLCCASGNRSGMATDILRSHGIECVNGGGWMEVNYLVGN
ncbi:MAG: rhodanese-like domain-containing protein [Bacteroidetes bacterium]|nr:rhodanese-like domain-containing protein [Bacteroidota bacterium]